MNIFLTQVLDDDSPNKYIDDEAEDYNSPTINKNHNYSLIDEKTDSEDIDKKNNLSDDGVWVNINDLPWGYDDSQTANKYIDDEAEEDLEYSDHSNELSVDDGDDMDSFIDDGTQDSLATDDDDDHTDDDF